MDARVQGDDLYEIARAVVSFTRWAKESLPVSNSIMALDVLLGIYLAERDRAQPTTFKELSWDLRHGEQAIRMIANRLEALGWIVLEQDSRFGRSISRLRIAPGKAGALKDGLVRLRAAIPGKVGLPSMNQPAG